MGDLTMRTKNTDFLIFHQQIILCVCVSECLSVCPHQARKGVVHAVLQRAPLQDGEKGGVVKTAGRDGHQVLDTLPQ